MSGETEFAQGKAMADAAVAEGVEYFLCSALPNAAVVTKGALKHIDHFNSKAKVEEYVRQLPIKSAFYWPAMFASEINGEAMLPRKVRSTRSHFRAPSTDALISKTMAHTP